jgi:hypothetical protein
MRAREREEKVITAGGSCEGLQASYRTEERKGARVECVQRLSMACRLGEAGRVVLLVRSVLFLREERNAFTDEDQCDLEGDKLYSTTVYQQDPRK